MRYPLVTLSLALLLFQGQSPFAATATSPAEEERRLRGINPTNLHLYDAATKNDKFTCLDGSQTIPRSSVNNNYCDCKDASDEPGTSACPNGLFHCQNTLHIPGVILSSRVNDGVCDPQCCDGSDEYDGRIKCPNLCEKAGAQHRHLKKVSQDKQRRGYMVKQQWIEKGRQLQSEREIEVGKLQVQVNEAQIVAEALRIEKEKVEEEEKIAADTAKKLEDANPSTATTTSKSSRESSLAIFKDRLRDVTAKVHLQHEYIKNLLSVLHDLKRDHNQNYNDMAVKSAIKGYDELLPEHPEVEDMEDFDTVLEDVKEPEADNDEHSPDKPGETLLSHPESLWVKLVDKMNEVPQLLRTLWYWTLGTKIESVLRDSKSSIHTAYSEASNTHSDLERQISELHDKLKVDYGKDQEWASVDGDCLTLETGGYTYEVCLFGKATQKSKDGSNVSLGTFDGWASAADKATADPYHKMAYRHGMRCWNGPERSIVLTLECGTANALLDVAEPEKCEYSGRLISPAACSPIDEKDLADSSSSTKIEHEEL